MTSTGGGRPCRSEHGALLVDTAVAPLTLPYDQLRQQLAVTSRRPPPPFLPQTLACETKHVHADQDTCSELDPAVWSES